MEKNQDLSSGKTCRGPSPRTKDRTSKRCLKQSSVLRNRPPRCLRLKKGDGQTQTTMWETDGQSRIEFLMRNGGAFPREEQESFLSQILQVRVPRKYYLSPKACQGILRRAEKRVHQRRGEGARYAHDADGGNTRAGRNGGNCITHSLSFFAQGSFLLSS